MLYVCPSVGGSVRRIDDLGVVLLMLSTLGRPRRRVQSTAEVNYHAQTEPVMAHYDALATCKTARVNGNQKPAEVWTDLRAVFVPALANLGRFDDEEVDEQLRLLRHALLQVSAAPVALCQCGGELLDSYGLV